MDETQEGKIVFIVKLEFAFSDCLGFAQQVPFEKKANSTKKVISTILDYIKEK